MREYELTFIVQPEISEEGLEAIQERFERTLDQQGAQKLFYEDWGRRRLAYEIQSFQKGHYMVLHYLDEGRANPEMERVARLDDSVLRFLTVLADDEVQDVEARKAQATDLEQERIRKARERAEREAEEAVARAEEAATRAEETAARAKAAESPPAPGEGATDAAAAESESPTAPAEGGEKAERVAPESGPDVESVPDVEEKPAVPAEAPEPATEGESVAASEEQPS